VHFLNCLHHSSHSGEVVRQHFSQLFSWNLDTAIKNCVELAWFVRVPNPFKHRANIRFVHCAYEVGLCNSHLQVLSREQDVDCLRFVPVVLVIRHRSKLLQWNVRPYRRTPKGSLLVCFCPDLVASTRLVASAKIRVWLKLLCRGLSSDAFGCIPLISMLHRGSAKAHILHYGGWQALSQITHSAKVIFLNSLQILHSFFYDNCLRVKQIFSSLAMNCSSSLVWLWVLTVAKSILFWIDWQVIVSCLLCTRLIIWMCFFIHSRKFWFLFFGPWFWEYNVFGTFAMITAGAKGKLFIDGCWPNVVTGVGATKGLLLIRHVVGLFDLIKFIC